MSEKCFCHLIVDGVAYKVKDADARKSIEDILQKIENGEIGAAIPEPGVETKFPFAVVSKSGEDPSLLPVRMFCNTAESTSNSVPPGLSTDDEIAAVVGYDESGHIAVSYPVRSWEAANKKYVDGVANGKRDLLTDPDMVYVCNGSGVQTGVLYGQMPKGGTIPWRNSDGTFQVTDPTHLQHPVTLNYLEQNAIMKSTAKDIVYATDADGNNIELPLLYADIDNTGVAYKINGRIMVADPTSLQHAVTLNYLRNHYVSITTYQNLVQRFDELSARVAELENGDQYYLYIDQYVYDKLFVTEDELANVTINGECYWLSKEEFVESAEGQHGTTYRYALPAGVSSYYIYMSTDTSTINAGTATEYNEYYSGNVMGGDNDNGLLITDADAYIFAK